MTLREMLNELLHLLEIGEIQGHGSKLEIVLHHPGVLKMSPVKTVLNRAIIETVPIFGKRRLFAKPTLEIKHQREVADELMLALDHQRGKQDDKETARDELQTSLAKLIKLEARRHPSVPATR